MHLPTVAVLMAALPGLLLPLSLRAQPAAAPDWVALGEDAGFRYLVDAASLRGDPMRRSVQVLFDARSPGQPVQSMRVLLEADCGQARARIVARTAHAQPMGGGPELALPIARTSGWDFLRPGSAHEAVHRFACAASESEVLAAQERSGLGPAARGGIAPPAARPAAGGPVVVPLQRQGGTLTVPVTVNDRVTLQFIVDSGASDVNIPSDVVARLIDNGTLSRADFTGRRTYRLADGSRHTAETFRIRSLRIGGRVVEDVTGTVGTISSPFLLGQSFLRRLKSWSIDNANDALHLH